MEFAEKSKMEVDAHSDCADYRRASRKEKKPRNFVAEVRL